MVHDLTISYRVLSGQLDDVHSLSSCTDAWEERFIVIAISAIQFNVQPIRHLATFYPKY